MSDRRDEKTYTCGCHAWIDGVRCERHRGDQPEGADCPMNGLVLANREVQQADPKSDAEFLLKMATNAGTYAAAARCRAIAAKLGVHQALCSLEAIALFQRIRDYATPGYRNKASMELALDGIYKAADGALAEGLATNPEDAPKEPTGETCDNWVAATRVGTWPRCKLERGHKGRCSPDAGWRCLTP